MKHARDDYNRIQDPAGIIPEDEPVFLIRGQDLSGPETLRHWARENSANGGDPRATQAALEQADRMVEWQKNVKMKAADLPT